MTAATDFYIPSSWRFRQITLLAAAHFVAVTLIQAPVSMAQSDCNTSGSSENRPQQQCPQSNCSETQSESSDGNFPQRLTSFYKADWTGKLPSTPAPARRMLDAPLDSPPFPSSDWGYGGSSAIGVPDGNIYPLMTALGKEHSRNKVYGWVAASVNASTSSNNNFPLSYDIFPNRVEMNQAVIYAERLPNTVGGEHFDWGYHLTAFYGIDYRFTTAKGYFSQQLLQKNHQYGFDPVLEYLDLYFPVREASTSALGAFFRCLELRLSLLPTTTT